MTELNVFGELSRAIAPGAGTNSKMSDIIVHSKYSTLLEVDVVLLVNVSLYYWCCHL